MEATFLVRINLMDLMDLEGASEDLADSLDRDGFEVIEVKPWARPSLEGLSGEETVIPNLPVLPPNPTRFA